MCSRLLGMGDVGFMLTPLMELFFSSFDGLTKSVTQNAFPALHSSRAHFSSDSNNILIQEEDVSIFRTTCY